MSLPSNSYHIRIPQEFTNKFDQLTTSIDDLRQSTIKLDHKITKIAIAVIGVFFIGYITGVLMTQSDCQNMQ